MPEAAPQQQLKITWDQLKEPIDSCELLLATLGVAIYQACQPATIRLPKQELDEYRVLASSTNKDLTELQNELRTMKQLIEPLYGTQVDEQSLLVQYNYGTSLLNINEQASFILKPDVERLGVLFNKGIQRQRDFENEQKGESNE